jgi:SAM-dependent methyltransferase
MAIETLAPTGPNAEQITYWNQVSAEKWIRYEELLDRQLAPFGERAIERARLRSADRALDVGCGCGATTLAVARIVGSGGSVLGVDISTPMLERARRRAADAGLDQARFANADAQTHSFAPAGFDVVCSRFGVMFFSDAERAFTNLHRAQRAGGTLSFVCWQGLEVNPWMGVPMRAAAAEIELPPRSAPDAPGPFSFADPERVRRILAGAGYGSIDVAPHDEELSVGGGTLDGAADFLVQMGPTGNALRAAPAEVRPRVVAAVRRSLEPYDGPNGVRLRFAVWLVAATA